ncbi:putative phospholipase/carboxylesterase [Rhexocercosporidium sp. MPI-PUGE-AT-0058]|nr:putative phospholipase/carboxylesterase [Rhexocercosporidium sp. MPI-PUGE-AT-0058]
MAQRPRIACFHGGGSNEVIFKTQCRQLQKELDSVLELVFFNAPFTSEPGPDILPAFATYAPFRSWFRIEAETGELADGSGYDDLGNGGLERVRKMMRAVGPAEEWVGVMGFSQGTRVVGGLLLDQQRRAQARARGEICEPCDIQIRFGVLCVGGGAPMLPTLNGIKAHSEEDLIAVPTLHYLGLRDINLPRGKIILQKYYDASSAKLWELDYHHAMPWVKSENLEFACLIKNMYSITRS